MSGKNNLVDNLSRNLDRARGKRDALASDVTTLTAQIAEIEARLIEEKTRRERGRVLGEIEAIKKRIQQTASAFAPVIGELCEATERAVAVVPEARELNSFLLSVATEVDSAVDLLLHELDQRADAARGAPIEPPKDNSDWLRLSRIGAPRETDVTKTNGSAPSSAVVGWALRQKPLVAIALVGLTAGRKVIGSRDLVGIPPPPCPEPLEPRT
jgi:predicted transcriptional regulator